MVAKLKLKGFKKYFFKYLVCDDFLPQKDFEFLSSINTDNIILDGSLWAQIITVAISNNNEIKESYGTNEEFYKDFDSNYFFKLHKYFQPILSNILNKISPMKSHLIDTYDYQLVLIDKDFVYPIHDDVPDKLLSVVVYLAPEYNMGTRIYACPEYTFNFGDSKKVGTPIECNQIQWKQNRAFIFSRVAQKTWHSYQGDGKNSRLSLVINVCTKRVDEVNKIESSDAFKKSVTWTY